MQDIVNNHHANQQTLVEISDRQRMLAYCLGGTEISDRNLKIYGVLGIAVILTVFVAGIMSAFER